MFISICTCSINAKYEVKNFVDFLNRHNADIDFEIVLTHDNRVNDGSKELFIRLQERYKNFKVVEFTKDDSLSYLNNLINWYDDNNIFENELIDHLRNNLTAYGNDEFFDVDKGFLWLSSGILYNKAVSESKGDVLIVTPSDFIYMFQLSDVENIMAQSYTYAKPHKRSININNTSLQWIKDRIVRAPTRGFHRDILGSKELKDHYFINPLNQRITSLNDDNVHTEMKSLCRESDKSILKSYHGFHFIQRSAYDEIGGFTEAFFGRAFADDIMAMKGRGLEGAYMNYLPDNLTVGDPSNYQLPDEQNMDALHHERLREVDRFFEKHPRQSNVAAKYLHQGYKDKPFNNIHRYMVDKIHSFIKSYPVVRFDV